MPTSHPGTTMARLAGLAVVCALVGGCAEDPADIGRPLHAEAAAADEATVGHLGRVHVVLQPWPDEIEPEPQLQVLGRFVEYRGVSEDFVRARTNLPVPAWEQLVPGQCIASEELLPSAATPREDEGARELSMIDAGDLRVLLGNRELVAPLALVPDLLPWLSGVEYAQVDDRIPRLAVEPDGTSPVVVSVDGSPDGTLEGFSAAVDVPVQLALEAARVGDGRLTIDWRPPGQSSRTIVLRLQAFAPGEDGVRELAGEEVTCLVADTGRADLALAPLASAGLGVEGAEAELLRVSASRFDAEHVSAGRFGLVDVFVEVRAQRTLPLQ
ncbi:hypothetical protein ENSA5_46520 [Enhygromyxa salina]|uniref:Uncharacterized protein n=1 Tax=Enhygromyxa salina TaxID=215803 RepID=A0A2S9XJ32_9BACT|nr:hypothetical protein [Enhygromyxa salina]PRP92886.1 hypothetical protein ENSA5_46520 [Enhygromyxa salina]